MKYAHLLYTASILALAMPTTSRGDSLVPAGTLLTCTVSEPNFSSKTADIGDPVLCYANPVASLGRTVLPYGTYLEGRFQDYKDPGHFVGKGWMELNFDRMISGPDRIVPISAKVVKVPGYKTDKKGRIIGRGHAVRDTVEWMIPVLWPIKILTLPARGPRPVLKQETRLTLKVMDDALVPSATSARSVLPRSLAPSSMPYRTPVAQPYRPTLVAENRSSDAPRSVTVGSVSNEPVPMPSPKDLAMLILKDGTVNLASDYWLEGSSRIRYVSTDGTVLDIPLEKLDLQMTFATNQRRGVNFALREGNSARPQ